MPNESIFHRIVSSENSYTQLLCNTLKREPSLLGDLLGLADIELGDPIESKDIRTLVHLNGCGQADLCIQTDKLAVIFEVKTDPRRPLEPTQHLRGKLQSYQHWLEDRRAEGRDACLIYLVPGNWDYRQDNVNEIAEYKRMGREWSIKVGQTYWGNFLQLLSESDSRTRSPNIDEFRLLLMERFAPINFRSKRLISCLHLNFQWRLS